MYHSNMHGTTARLATMAAREAISYSDLMKDFKESTKKLLSHSKEDSKMQQQPHAF